MLQKYLRVKRRFAEAENARKTHMLDASHVPINFTVSVTLDVFLVYPPPLTHSISSLFLSQMICFPFSLLLLPFPLILSTSPLLFL